MWVYHAEIVVAHHQHLTEVSANTAHAYLSHTHKLIADCQRFTVDGT